MSNYPVILVHGLFGWGAEDKLYAKLPYFGTSNKKEVSQNLNAKGYEIYVPSVGPILCAWDRCCELWAYLMGGTVDYGKVHSEKHGCNRYGRTYEHGVLEDWGQPGNHAKINLIGHSFGGPTVKMFQDIIARGLQEEIDGTPAEELSDFFKANKPQKIHSVTTLSGVNNGTTYASMSGRLGNVAISYSLLLINALIGETNIHKWWDFHTDHYNIMPDRSKVTKNKLTNPLTKMKGISAYAWNLEGSIAQELRVEIQCDLNETQETNPGIYYFARRACRSNVLPGRWAYLDADGDNLCKLLCGLTSFMTFRPGLKKYGVDKTWCDNDGIVPVVGQSAPLNAPQKDYEAGETVKPGLWYNMPVERKDHMSWAGIGEDKDTYLAYYEDMLKMLNALPDAD